MLQITTADGRAEKALMAQLKARSGEVDRQVTAAVEQILADVKRDGDAAVRSYTEKFDGKAPEKTQLSRADMEAGMQSCDPAFLAALEQAADNIRAFHEKQKQQSWLDPQKTGSSWASGCEGSTGWGFTSPAARRPTPRRCS